MPRVAFVVKCPLEPYAWPIHAVEHLLASGNVKARRWSQTRRGTRQ